MIIYMNVIMSFFNPVRSVVNLNKKQKEKKTRKICL
jgi:hypothetical protein